MYLTVRSFVHFFVTYKYVALFPVAVIEGPIITLIAGFLLSREQLEFLPTLVVVVLGDVVSDFVLYMIGRTGNTIVSRLKFIGVTEARLQRVENQFGKSPWKTMIVAKFSYGLGSVFMVACGMVRMSWQKFFEYVISLNTIRSLILLGLGYYFGRVAVRMGPTYLKYYAIGVLVLVPVIYLIRRNMNKNKPD